MSRALAVPANVDARLAALERRVALLEAACAPRHAADAHLLAELARVADGRPFTATAMMAHARVDDDLAAALGAAGVLSGLELGAHLRELQDRICGGLRLVRGKRTGGGFTWRIMRVVV